MKKQCNALMKLLIMFCKDYKIHRKGNIKLKQLEAPLLPNRIRKKNILVMKLSFSLYIIGCFQLMAFNGFSQDKISLDIEDSTLDVIIASIEQQTSYDFIYNNDEINGREKMNINVFEEKLSTTLIALFKNTAIDYKIKEKHIVLYATTTKSQEKHTISGVLSDNSSGETLFGANIIIKGTNSGTVTNEYGFYSITLPQDSYTLQLSYMGYALKEITIDLLEDRKLNVALEPFANELNEVVISSSENSKSQVKSILSGVINLKASEIKQLPSFMGEPDITRAILTQPGVSSTGEGTSGFNVRGGNIDQNLILLDEAPLYNSSHLFGLFSSFNADAIKDLKLYKGGIPARFGGRASSVLDIRQKEGNTKEFKGEGGVGLLFSRLTLEGPLKKDKVSYLISGRRSYFDLFFPLSKDLKGNKFYFYDLNTKISWNIDDKNKLYLSGYFGADVMQFNFEGEQQDDRSAEDESVNLGWKNATATLRWNHVFSNRLFANITGVYSKYNYSLGVENNFEWKSSIHNWIFKPDFTFYANPSTKIRFGVNATLYNFIPADITVNEVGLNEISFDTERALEVAPYVEVEKKWDKLAMNIGVRHSLFSNFGELDVATYNSDYPKTENTITGTTHYEEGETIQCYNGFEPRLSLSYRFNDRKAFKIGYNRMFQYIHLISNTSSALPFDIWKPSGTHIKPLEVNQISAGYAYDTDNGMYNFSLESYYKTFKNIVEYKNGADLFVNEFLETQLLAADGYSYGVELSAYKNTGKLTGNINYTYSVTRRKTVSEFVTENINNGAYYPSNYDRPHMLNVTANYKLNKKWSLGAFFTYQTGRPTTQPTGRFTFNGDPYLTYSDRNAYRISDTHRLDISMTYTPSKKKTIGNLEWQGSWSYGVYNVYNHKNAFSEYSTFSDNALTTSQFSLIGAPIPFITYNFKF